MYVRGIESLGYKVRSGYDRGKDYIQDGWGGGQTKRSAKSAERNRKVRKTKGT